MQNGCCDTNKDNMAGLLLRLTLGFVMLPHGLQKTLGLFGGYGFEGTMGFLTGHAHLPYLIALLVVLGESLGSLGLIFGVMTRFCAFGVFCIMLGAIFTVHMPNGFFMNWGGTQAGEGFEYHILAIGISLALMSVGGGKWSFDANCCKKNKAN